jgi:cytochrome c oxidase subunit 3
MKLEVGTTKALDVVEVKRKKTQARSFSGGPNGNGNRDKGGGGNGGDGGRPDEKSDQERFVPDKYRIGMWLVLLVVAMTFAGLISAYVVIAINKQIEWKPFVLPIQIWVSTVLILVSSITFEVAKKRLLAGEQESARNWFLGTTVLGATFIASQILAWLSLVRAGVYVASNPYAGFFYILTAVHALHVIGGMIALGYTVLRNFQTTSSDEELLRRRTGASVTALYWHFMGGLWIVLFLLLGFWK